MARGGDVSRGIGDLPAGGVALHAGTRFFVDIFFLVDLDVQSAREIKIAPLLFIARSVVRKSVKRGI